MRMLSPDGSGIKRLSPLSELPEHPVRKAADSANPLSQNLRDEPVTVAGFYACVACAA